MPIIAPADGSTVGTVMLGTQRSGDEFYFDLATGPHVLIAGTTGSGKSVLINQIITQLMQRPREDVQIMLIDPKMVEFADYEDCKHILGKIANDVDDAVVLLDEAIEEMELRNGQFKKHRCRDLDSFNKATGYGLARIFMVIDEYGDLMLQDRRRIEPRINRLAQKARSAGIHLILATQRPSADIVTGAIRANFPTRICLRVASGIDSRIVLGENGAEDLRKPGEMIFAGAGTTVRLRCANITTEEIQQAALSDDPHRHLEQIEAEAVEVETELAEKLGRLPTDSEINEVLTSDWFTSLLDVRRELITRSLPPTVMRSTPRFVEPALRDVVKQMRDDIGKAALADDVRDAYEAAAAEMGPAGAASLLGSPTYRAVAPSVEPTSSGETPTTVDMSGTATGLLHVEKPNTAWTVLGKVSAGIVLLLLFFAAPVLVVIVLVIAFVWFVAQHNAYTNVVQAERELRLARFDAEREHGR